MTHTNISAWGLPRFGDGILNQAQQSLANYRREVESTWTPGQTCWAILQEVNLIESRTPTDHWEQAAAADKVAWLGQLLQISVDRTLAIGAPGASATDGVITAVDQLHSALDRVVASVLEITAACGLVRLEIHYLAGDS